ATHPPATLNLYKNEIYARHGYLFEDIRLQQHFRQFSWYRFPQKTAPKNIAAALTSKQKQCLSAIKTATKRHRKHSEKLVDLNGDGKKETIAIYDLNGDAETFLKKHTPAISYDDCRSEY